MAGEQIVMVHAAAAKAAAPADAETKGDLAGEFLGCEQERGGRCLNERRLNQFTAPVET